MNKEQARKAIDLIIEDLVDRKGLGDEWDRIDGTTQNEIIAQWVDILLDA